MTTDSKIVKLEGVGEILFEKSSIAKNVRISFRPPSYIRVAVPRRVTFSEAQKFAEIKSAWIKKQIKRFSSPKTFSLYNKSSELSLKDIDIESDIIKGVMNCAPGANAITKEIVLATRHLERSEMIDFAAKGFAERMLSDEGREGISSCIEKRKPKWSK